MQTQKKALALMSGGLDSLLAAKIIMEQGILVEGITFLIGFAKADAAIAGAKQLGIKLHVVDVVEEFQAVVANPKHGYGANLNPCLDCKIFMVRKAKEWLEEHDFDFIVTGEVLGQRPMSQRKETLPIVAKESGAEDLLLRPLSAKLLSPTLPERESWVDRNMLYDIEGRSRKRQIELTAKYGIKKYPAPAGGCLLTESGFCARLRDLWATRGSKEYTKEDIELLKLGRHLRLNPELKLIVGRNEQENLILEKHKDRYITLETSSHPGPTALVVGSCSKDEMDLIARIVARFSGGRNEANVMVRVRYIDGTTDEINVKPMPPDEIDPNWYI